MKRHLLTFVLCTLSLCSFATTRYASPSGTGNGTSYASPTSWSTGLSATAGGDTLYLLGGEYRFDGKQTIGTNKNGFSQNKRTFIGAFPGETPILDFSAQPYGSEVTGSNNVGISLSANTQYIHIKELTIRYAGKNGLINYGSYNLFENLDVYGCGDSGVQMKNGGNNVILNVDSHDNFDYKTTGTGGVADFGGNADGFADKQFTGAGNHYIGCRAWNNSDDGWDFFQRVSSSNTIIENCVCYQNGMPYYDMTHNPRALGVDKPWFDSKVGTQMTDRYGQTITITLDRYPCQGNGNGFKMGGKYTDHKILIHHCLAVANNARGFDQNNNGGTMWVYNNTGYDNGVNFGFTTAYGTNELRNNISYRGKNADQPKSKSVIAIDHNSWNGFNLSASDFQSLDTTQILAPRAADGSLPESTCLHLASGSSLINAGIDVNLWYNDFAPDLGCYETPGERHDPEPPGEDTIPSVQPEGTHAIAFVTIPKSPEDKALLQYLRANDSLWVVETDATDPEVDYSTYEVIVLGSKPSSSASGFTPLKGYAKPMVLLKPWLLKQGVWSWGTAVNTEDLSISVTNASHPLFEGLTIANNEVQLFARCDQQKAVTAISAWTNTEGFDVLASPVSKLESTSIAFFPQGTVCNGTTLPQPMYMIGVSEYSTAYLTTDGKRLIENAICLLLGIPNNHPFQPLNIENHQSEIINHKFIQNGKLFIRMGEAVFDLTGRRISR